MKGKSLLVLAATVALAVGIVSCGGGSPPSETPAAPAGAPAAGGKTVDPATAGSVSGTVKFDGAAPRMRPINMAAEPSCAKVHATAATTQDVLVATGGALQNVVVYLKGDFSQYSFPPPSAPVTLDQKGCLYTPHVLAVQVGSPVSVQNSDQTTHNIHPVPMINREWNQSQPPGAPPLEQEFARAEVMIPVKCNVHPWMKAYVGVQKHPFAAVSGADGTFSIKGLPPGDYTLESWQEKYGAQTQKVTVGPKETKTVDFSYKG